MNGDTASQLRVTPQATLRAIRSPPLAPQQSHQTRHHGRERDDPWHWLRDPRYPKVEDTEILAYLEAENEYFSEVMSPHQALRETLYFEAKARHIEDDASVPVQQGTYLYQWRFEKGAEYRTWWRKPAETERGAWACFLNEPELADGHEYFSLGGFDISPDESLIAWAVDTSGAERYRAHLKSIHDEDVRGLDLPDMIGAPIFAMDGQSLVYVVVNDQWRPWQVWVHALDQNTPDRCIFEESDERFRVGVHLTRCKTFLVITTGDHTTSECLVLSAGLPRSTPRVVIPRKHGCQYDLHHAHGRFYVRINDTHENFRLVSMPESAFDHAHWREEIAPSDAVYLRDINAFDKWLVVSEKMDALDHVRIRDYSGNEHRAVFPESVYAASLGNTPEFNTSSIRIHYESLVTPETTFDYLPESRELVTRKVQDVPGYDATRYRTRRIWAEARDGKRIPISLVSCKAEKKPHALHLYGYGAYGIGMTPSFNLARISMLDRGVAFAIAHIRGGDELGRNWYLQGKRTHRANTFNDFVDAARHLIATGQAEAGRIAISGGSAGGELMGAVINQAPELWGAVVAHVPFVDVLNTMLDATLPLTPPEWDEWGNPIQDKEAYDLIASYCPYTQTSAKDYPPMLVTAGLSDPRVTYWEPAKWVAKLRHSKTDDNILLLKTNMGAGHGGKSGRFERLREKADEQAFMLLALGLAPAPR
ncbi:MAG: S9 family peptidase [Gammaproteobacteria bacterium]|nr:S9 family peptidase [Gammaproteobacteria bacterium]